MQKRVRSPVSINVKTCPANHILILHSDILNHFGFHVENDHYETFHIYPRTFGGNQTIQYTVEGDWSNVAFLLVSGAIAGEVSVSGADINSSQGDKKIINALESCGASVHIDQKEITVKKNNLTAFDFDATHSPDLFPPLVALAAYCEGYHYYKRS